MKVSFQKIKYPSTRHLKMRHKSKAYFPECFVYNAMSCQRGKSLWSLSIWKQLPFFFYNPLYNLIGVEKYFSRNKLQILNAALLYPFVSWFIFIKMWKLAWYWEAAETLSLKEIIKFTRWHTIPSLMDFLLTWFRSKQWNISTSSILKN